MAGRLQVPCQGTGEDGAYERALKVESGDDARDDGDKYYLLTSSLDGGGNIMSPIIF